MLAAASLTESFRDVVAHFQQSNPGVKVTLTFGASSTLVTQLAQGAPGDVLATADTATMDYAVTGHSAENPAVFTCNRLALIVPKGNPKHLRSLKSLAESKASFVVCAAPVPCGKFARQALTKAKVKAGPLGSEQDAKAVVSKVELGEANAGIAYVTDADGARDKVEAIPLPANEQVIAAYPIALTGSAASGGQRLLATRFVDYVRSSEGQEIMAAHGFQTR